MCKEHHHHRPTSLTQFVAASIVWSIYSENNEVRWKRAKNSFADYKFKTFLFNKRFFFWKKKPSKHPTNRLRVPFYAKFSRFFVYFLINPVARSFFMEIISRWVDNFIIFCARYLSHPPLYLNFLLIWAHVHISRSQQ